MSTIMIQKCGLCLRGFEDVKSNRRENNTRTICNVFLDNLKPNLSAANSSFNFNWSCFQESIPVLCKNCFEAGQRLERMKEGLKEIETEIQRFIHKLSKEILKHWEQNETLGPYHSEQYNDTYFGKEDIDLKIENEYFVLVNEGDFPLDLATVSQNLQQQDEFEEPHPIDDNDFFPNSWDDEDDTHENMTIPQQDPNNSEEDVLNRNSNDIDNLLSQIKSRRLFVSLERLQLNTNGQVIPKVPMKMKTEVETLNVDDLAKRQQTPKKRRRLVYSKRNPKPKKFSKEKDEETFSDTSSSCEESDENCDSDGDFVPSKKFCTENRKFSSKKQKTQAKKDNKGQFQCNQCGGTFTRKDTKKSHMLQQHEDIPFNCKHCHDRFDNNASLREHINTIHKDKSLICKSCPELSEFTNDYEFEVHCMSHAGEIPYECSKCHEKFASAKNYCEHQKRSPCATSEGKFKCEECDEAFQIKTLLLIHKVVRHNQIKPITTPGFTSYSCDICGDGKRRSLLNLESHYAEHTNEFVSSCDICGKGFRNTEKFSIHRKTHISYQCKLCDFTTHSPNSLKLHIKVTHTEVDNNEYTCDECGKKLLGKHKLSKHMYNCGKKVFCEICGKMFARGSIERHNKYHHSDSQQQTCSICEKQFLSVAALNQHRRVQHFKACKYMCDICGKVLHFKHSYELHVKSHEGLTHDCQICGEKFLTDYGLKKHHKVDHDIGENFSCRYCSEIFITYTQRRYHEFAVHAEVVKKEFKCKGCGITFETPQLRNVHRKKMHKELITIRVNRTCEICNKVFAHAAALRKHSRNHQRDNEG